MRHTRTDFNCPDRPRLKSNFQASLIVGYPKSVNVSETRIIKTSEMTSAEMRTPRCLSILQFNVGQIVSTSRLIASREARRLYQSSGRRGGPGGHIFVIFNVI